MRITGEELAQRLGIDVGRVDRLVRAGAIEQAEPGVFDSGDVHRVRLLIAFEAAGIPLESLIAAFRSGEVTFAFYDRLHPAPGAASTRDYATFAADQGDRTVYLGRLFAAFGLAEPDPGTHLSVDDETLIAEVLDIVVATGKPDLALRAVRMFGLGAQRAADASLGAYGDAFEHIRGVVHLEEEVARFLEPWAQLARVSATLGGWLSGQHMTRAIDAYSVQNTEEILEAAGLVAQRIVQPPAVAFVDLTGFTRLTEERGDEVAAALALRLGEVSVEAIAPHDGRLVKLLGDGVLLRFDAATAAIEGTLDLLDALPRAGLPTGHAGVAAGPLIARDGDVFGRTVNLAARIADVATDGRLLVPSTLAEDLPLDRYVFESTGASLLQGIGSTDLMAVIRRSP